jgi:putative CRISPR-associated protein (TIGR02619 family)
MTLYICTAGTSIAGGPLRAPETTDAYRNRIDAKLAADRAGAKSEQEFLIRTSAETNGLVRSKAGKADEVVFLTSETEDGEICGDRLVGLVEAELGCRARRRTVRGLQVRDGRRFRTVGIASLFEVIERETRERTPDEIQLNATGGFKGTVPYLVLYGMFSNLPVSYVYEFSASLITLPPLAVEFDWERILPAEEAIVTICSDGPIAEQRWSALMPADYAVNQDRYDPLFEREDGLVSLSAIGLLMKARLDAAATEAEVMLSPTAARALESAPSGARAQFDAMLSRVRNPLHRSAFRHSESLHATDLKVWKPHAQQRMLYWLDVGRILVGELFETHDAYEQYVNSRPLRRRDYDLGAFIRKEASGGPDYSALLRDIQQSNAEPVEQARRLEDELRQAKIEVQRLRTKNRAELKRERQMAESRGYAQGRRASEAEADKQLAFAERQKRFMRDALQAKLRAGEDEVARLQGHIRALEAMLEQTASASASAGDAGGS